MRRSLIVAALLLACGPAWGAVAFDAVAESHTATPFSTSAASFSWSHNPVGTPRGVIVFVFNMNNTGDDALSVTYDGTSVPAVSGGEAADTVAGEAGRCVAFFLGSSVPTTDPATVVVNRNNNANIMYAISVTVTAATDTEVYTAGILLEQQDQTLGEESITDNSPGTNSLRVLGLYSGLSSVPGVGASTTLNIGGDAGAFVAASYRETTPGQGARSLGASSGTSDDVAGVYFAVREPPVAGARRIMVID